MSSSLHQALGAERGIVCAIGAGGKKTTLFALPEHSQVRTGLTASVFTPPFPDTLNASIHLAELAVLRQQVPTDPASRVAYAVPTDKPRRIGPLHGGDITAMHRDGAFELTLVKADGARMRRIKAPGVQEPKVITGSTVLAISSVLALGRPLDERIAHRPERISEVTGHPLGEPVTPALVAALYLRPGGLSANTGDGPLVPVLNMVDDAPLQRAAREIAAALLDGGSRYDRVVLLSNRRRGHLVEVISR